jgi:hypothetical protein
MTKIKGGEVGFWSSSVASVLDKRANPRSRDAITMRYFGCGFHLSIRLGPQSK